MTGIGEHGVVVRIDHGEHAAADVARRMALAPPFH
jgi:hypothetical protein